MRIPRGRLVLYGLLHGIHEVCWKDVFQGLYIWVLHGFLQGTAVEGLVLLGG